MVIAAMWPALLAAQMPTVHRNPDGSIEYLGQQYSSMRAFMGSRAVADNGLRCGTETVVAEYRRLGRQASNPQLAQRAADCTSSVTNPAAEYDPDQNLTYIIPIWFHVITASNGVTGDVSNQRIADQIEVLNRDFAALDAASGTNTTIQFELVGTTRSANDSWFTSGQSVIRQLDYKSPLAVDPERYLNIYSKDIDGGLLGFAYYPDGAAGSVVDGVVMNHVTIGGRDNGNGRYDQGRTLVHEVGHYLGLLHTFETIGGSCQNSLSSGDLIADTPPQSSQDFGCSASTGCGVASAIENFMNYSDDRCMDEFSPQQTNRMICSLTSYRPLGYRTESGSGSTPDPEPPVATDDTAFVAEDSPGVAIAVSSNDTDPEGDLDLASIVITTPASNGSATPNNDGTVTYVPDSDYAGFDNFAYTISDGGGLTSNIATVSVTVTSVNDAPVANDDSATVDEDDSVDFSLTANDTDIDGSVSGASLVITRNPTFGSVANLGNGSARYTPDPNYSGADNFFYTVEDNSGSVSNEAQAVIIINAVNDPPVAVNDSASTPEDTPVEINVVQNDADVDGGIAPATVLITSPPSDGSAQATLNGTVNYTPATDYVGSDSFAYTVESLDGVTSNIATVQVTITAVDDPPVAVDDSAATTEDNPTTINVLANDDDVDNSIVPSTVAVVVQPGNGAAVANANGTITYTPTADFNGSDSFGYTVDNDVGVTTGTATVSITISAVNDAPVAASDSAAVVEDTPQVINVLSNDDDIDGSLVLTSVAVVVMPANGVASANPDGSVTYTPDLNYNGSDSFSYTVDDNDGLTSAPAVVSIDVASANDFPVAFADSATTPEDTAVDINLIANDTDDEGSVVPGSVALTDTPDNGSVVNNGDGTVRYIPTENFNGSDSFAYTVDDAGGLTSAPGQVSVTVTSVDDPTIAANDSASTDEDVAVDIDLTANDSDADGSIDDESIVITGQPGNGSVSILGGGRVRYTPDANFTGTDNFSYTVDNTDGVSSNPATVSVAIGAVNDRPVANDDSLSLDEDTSAVVNVVANDTDAEGGLDASSVVITIPPSEGVAMASVDGTVEYTPDANFNGSDNFAYTVADNDGLVSTAAIVSISVQSVDDPTVATADTATTAEDRSVTVDLIGNDSDDDGTLDPESLAVAQQPSNGGVISNGDGSVVYTPATDFNGSDSFTYRIRNTDGVLSNTASVTITVTPVNDAPIAGNDGASTDINVPVVINVIANDSDAEGSVAPSSLAIVSQPSNGAIGNPGTGLLTYTPNPDFVGVDTFSYRVSDQTAVVSNTATVRVVVEDPAELEELLELNRFPPWLMYKSRVLSDERRGQ